MRDLHLEMLEYTFEMLEYTFEVIEYTFGKLLTSRMVSYPQTDESIPLFNPDTEIFIKGFSSEN